MPKCPMPKKTKSLLGIKKKYFFLNKIDFLKISSSSVPITSQCFDLILRFPRYCEREPHHKSKNRSIYDDF